MCYEAISSNLYPENESISITWETFQVKGMHTVILTVPMLYSLQPVLWLTISSFPTLRRSTINFTIYQTSSSKIYINIMVYTFNKQQHFFLCLPVDIGLSFADPERQVLSNNNKNKQGSISFTQGKDTT